MSQEKLDLIEQRIKSKKVAEYEIFLVKHKNFESIFLKDRVDNKRDISDFEYILRILTQKENQTGIGLVKGNSLEPNEIARNIDICISIAKNNLSSKFHFPSEASFQDVSILDKKIIQDPLTIKNDLAEELLSEVRQHQEVQATFGRFRVHIDEIFLRNSNTLNLRIYAYKLYPFKEDALSKFLNMIIYPDKTIATINRIVILKGTIRFGGRNDSFKPEDSETGVIHSRNKLYCHETTSSLSRLYI